MAVTSLIMSTVSDLNFLFVLQLLLILSGDVEVNPGPLTQGIYIVIATPGTVYKYIISYLSSYCYFTEDEKILAKVDASTFGKSSSVGSKVDIINPPALIQPSEISAPGVNY